MTLTAMTLTARPGSGRITWVDLRLTGADPGQQEPRLVPWPADDDEVEVAERVDIVFSHASRTHAVGAVITLDDAEAAAALASLAAKAADLLGGVDDVTYTLPPGVVELEDEADTALLLHEDAADQE